MPRILGIAKRILSKIVKESTIIAKSPQSKIQPISPIQPVTPVQPIQQVQPPKTSIGGAIVDGMASGFGWGIGTNLARSIFGGSNVSSESNVSQSNSHIQTQTHTDKIEENNSHSSIGNIESVKNNDSELYSYEIPSDDSYGSSGNESWDDE